MLNLKIITAIDEKLKQKSIDLTQEELKTHSEIILEFAEFLTQMVKSNNAVGIASTQVDDNPKFNFLKKTNENQRQQPSIFIFLLNDKDLTVAINPKILSYSEEKTKSQEGCLSIPGVVDTILRAKTIEVEYININGTLVKTTLGNFDAIVFQHEFDHLNGILFPDHLENFFKKEEFWKKYNNKKK